VLAVLLPSVILVNVIVQLPTVLKLTLRDTVPEAMAVFPCKVAAASVVDNPTVFELFTMFQFASTAFAVTFNAVPEDAAIGLPVFPLAVPGALVSPGTSNCIFAKAPATTVRVPKLVLLDTPVKVAVPELVKFPLPAAPFEGLTRRF
jgi:hypothetical protein